MTDNALTLEKYPMKPSFSRCASTALLVLGAIAYPAPSYSGFADPVVRAAPLPPGATVYPLDLRGYCRQRYGSRYYPHNFSCWTGYQNDQPVRIDPTAACRSLHGENYRAIDSGMELVCIDR